MTASEDLLKMPLYPNQIRNYFSTNPIPILFQGCQPHAKSISLFTLWHGTAARITLLTRNRDLFSTFIKSCSSVVLIMNHVRYVMRNMGVWVTMGCFFAAFITTTEIRYLIPEKGPNCVFTLKLRLVVACSLENNKELQIIHKNKQFRACDCR